MQLKIIYCLAAVVFGMTAQAACAGLPQYEVVPMLSAYSLNNRNELLMVGGAPGGGSSYDLVQFPDRTLIGTVTPPPDGWPGGWQYLRGYRSRLTDDGLFTTGAVRDDGAGGLVETAIIGNLRTGTIQVLEGSPVNGDDEPLPRISSNAAYVVLQGGPERRSLQPYRWSETEGWTPLGNLYPTGDGRPLAVNASGTVVGRTADLERREIPFIYTDSGGMQAITDGGTTIYGRATAINDAGLVTGTANGRVFTFDSNTLEIKYITEGITGWLGLDINNSGSIIGSNGLSGSGGIFGVPSGSAFYWDDTLSAATSLDNLIGDAVNEWFITDATDINDNGWILATGFHRTDNTYRSLMLRPVPEPGALMLIMVAAVFCSMRFRRRLAPVFVCFCAVLSARPAQACTTLIRIEGTLSAIETTTIPPVLPADSPMATAVTGTPWVIEGLLLTGSVWQYQGSDFTGVMLLGGVPFLSWGQSLVRGSVGLSVPADPGEGDYRHWWQLSHDTDGQGGLTVEGQPAYPALVPEFALHVVISSGYREMIPCNPDSLQGFDYHSTMAQSYLQLVVAQRLPEGDAAYSGESAYWVARGDVSSVTVIPEPTAAALIGMSLFQATRRRWRA
jgi:hypothetical protein